MEIKRDIINFLGIDKITLRTSPENIGIKFKAKVKISESPIRPANTIHIRYIQNLNERTGVVGYGSPPSLIATLEDGASFPLVDWYEDCPSTPPFPYYSCNFEETNPTGTERTITVTDGPNIQIGNPRPILDRISRGKPTGFVADHDDLLESIIIINNFTMFLGCYDDTDPTFRTLAALDWNANFVGTFTAEDSLLGPGVPQFSPGSIAGIYVEPVPSKRIPTIDGPVAFDSIIYELHELEQE
jgi:hypothetical protein